MKKLPLIICLLLFTSPLFATPHSELSESEKIATTFVEQLAQGEFKMARSAFDPAMAATMPTSTLRKSWIKLQAKTGDFIDQTDTSIESNPHYDIVDVNCTFEHLNIEVKLIIEDQKIAGLYFVRATT